MTLYIVPWAMKYIIILASVAAIVCVVDIVMIVRRKVERLLPLIDSILVIAGLMAVVGTGMALIYSLNAIAGSNNLNSRNFFLKERKQKGIGLR